MPKTALVLSAGGSFGAYQVGVWKVLERQLRPDLVIGTSIGSIHAWCIAGGATAAELEQMWLDPARAPQFRLRMPRSWRHGVFDPRRMERQIQELHTRYRPQRPVGIVCTGVRTLRQHLFTNGEITWQHIAGSCAVPGVLDLRQLDGATYADGGLFDSVNIWAAFAMGAEQVIAVNCWKPRPLALIDRPLGWLAGRRRKQIDEPAQPPAFDGWIEPAGELGSFADSLRWHPEQIRHWIELGVTDAQRLEQFRCGMF